MEVCPEEGRVEELKRVGFEKSAVVLAEPE